MPRATPLELKHRTRTPNRRTVEHRTPASERPVLLLIQGDPALPRRPRPSNPPLDVPYLGLVEDIPRTPQEDETPEASESLPAPAPAGASEAHRVTPLQVYAQAAERRKDGMLRFAAAAERVAGHAESLSRTLRTLRFAGSTV